jgi:hypothetical protein
VEGAGWKAGLTRLSKVADFIRVALIVNGIDCSSSVLLLRLRTAIFYSAQLLMLLRPTAHSIDYGF